MNMQTRRAGWSAALLAAFGSAFFLGRASHSYAYTPSGPAPQASSAAARDVPQGSSEAPPALPDFRGVAKRVVPAVVTVRSQKTIRADARSPFSGGPSGDDLFDRFFGGPRQRGQREQRYVQRGLGSGVIVSADGYIITNNHVVDGVDRIEVVLQDGTVVSAKILGADPQTDIAVIKVDRTGLPTIEIGDSDRLEVGEWVLAVGNPFSEMLGHTVTAGIVSAKGRSNLRLADYEDFIQTDAAINPGNSGGALVNTRSQLVGINSAIVSGSGGSQGIGFAIPINMARNVMDQLIKNGKVVRGSIGITIQDLSPDLAEGMGLSGKEGALVTEVRPGSPALGAGLKRGDAITAVDGIAVKSNSDLRNHIAATAPGTRVTLTIFREGQMKLIPVTLGELPSPGGLASRGAGHAPMEQALGLAVEPLTRDTASQLGYEGDEGVVVSQVESGSPADNAGAQEGDLIKEVNRQPISSMSDYRSALGAVKQGRVVLLLVRRGDAMTYLSLKP